jgi:hypothetical protein
VEDGGPVGALVGEKCALDVAETIRAATEGGANVGGDREARKNLVDGTIEDGVGTERSPMRKRSELCARMPIG